MSEEIKVYEIDERFNQLKQVLLENAYKLNTAKTCAYLPPAFLHNADFLYEFAKKVHGLIHPAITDQSLVSQEVFEQIGKSLIGFRGKGAKTVQSQIKEYFEGKASKTFLKTVISAEEKNFTHDPLNFESNVDNKLILGIVYEDKDLEKLLNASALTLGMTLKDLSKEKQDLVRLETIRNGVLQKFIENTGYTRLSCANVFEQILDRWDIPSLSTKVSEALLSAIQKWTAPKQFLPVLAEKVGIKHYTKSFTNNLVKTGVDMVGLTMLQHIPKTAIAPVVKDLFDAVVVLDASIAEKVATDSVLRMDTILDEEENGPAVERAYDILGKLNKEFKNKLSSRLIELICEEFSGYNCTTFTGDMARIATEESDYVEVFKLMLKQNPAHVLQEMCKTHQDSITRNLVIYALGDVIDSWYADEPSNQMEESLFEAMVRDISTAEDFSKIDSNVFSGSETADSFTKSITFVEKRWNKKHREVKEAFATLTSWQKIQVLSRFFILNLCGASYDPIVLIEEGANIKGNRQVRNYLPNSVNWALFELKEHAKDLEWSALTTKKVVKINDKEVKFFTLASKYFQATQCKNYNPYAGFDVGAYEDLCTAEKCAPYGDSAKSKALMYLTHLLGKNTPTAQALVSKAKNLHLKWDNVPVKLTTEEKAAIVRLLSESGTMWEMLHLFKAVTAKAGLAVSYKEFDKISVMHHYAGVTDDNYPIALQLKKWNFDEYVFQDCKDFKPKKKSNIPLFEKKYSEKYLAQVLKPGDARALVMGEESGCCQSVDNAASECAEMAYMGENSGIFAIDDEEGKLISQSFIWLAKNGKHLIIDSIETIHQLTKDSAYTQLIAKAYLDFAQELSAKNIQVVMSADNYNNTGRKVFEALNDMFPKEMKVKETNSYYSSGYEDTHYIYEDSFENKDYVDYSDLSERVLNITRLLKSSEKQEQKRK